MQSTNCHCIGYEIPIRTDHATIRYLMNEPTVSRRIVRWLLSIAMVDEPSKNVVVDYLPSLTPQGNAVVGDPR